jgi:glycosyltransferase involved in cell wall biosynthesis
MIDINITANINAEPWNIPIEERCLELDAALAQGKKIALLLYRTADTSTFRYRCYNLYQRTLDSNKWQCIYFFMNEANIVSEYLEKCTLFIICRIHWLKCLDDLIIKAKSLNKKIIFDVDDMVVDINYIPLLASTLNISFDNSWEYLYWFSDIGRLSYTASKADGFTCTNLYLAKLIEEKYNKPCEIIANSLNDEQMLISNECARLKKNMKSDLPFSIGYFSGSPSHINDFKVVYQEIIELLHDFPEMRLDVVGFMKFPKQLQTLIDLKRVTFTKLVDFIELQRLISQVDVNIVPLVNNEFTNCKSELKFFESSVVDTITLATPIYSYANSVVNGENGYLCQPGEWYDAIRNIFKQKTEQANIIKKAHTYCVDRYYGRNALHNIEQAYDKLLCEI